jgi:hypothetical protein
MESSNGTGDVICLVGSQDAVLTGTYCTVESRFSFEALVSRFTWPLSHAFEQGATPMPSSSLHRLLTRITLEDDDRLTPSAGP